MIRAFTRRLLKVRGGVIPLADVAAVCLAVSFRLADVVDVEKVGIDLMKGLGFRVQVQ